MEDVSFFMLAYSQPKATDECLKSVRKYYKTEKIVVFENGTNVLEDICIKHNAIYIHQSRNYQKPRPGLGKYASMKDLNDFIIFMNQHKVACELTDTKWLVFLESDCLLRRRFEYFPKVSVGGHLHNINTFSKSTAGCINRFRKGDHKEEYVYSLSGGSVVNREDLMRVCLSDWKKHLLYAMDVNRKSEIRCRDATLSYLFYINELEIEDWKELTEIKWSDELRSLTAAMVHDFKYFYE